MMLWEICYRGFALGLIETIACPRIRTADVSRKNKETATASLGKNGVTKMDRASALTKGTRMGRREAT